MLTLTPSTGHTPLVITALGPVTQADVKATLPLIARHQCDCGVIWDMRQSELSALHCQDIQSVVANIASELPKENSHRVAFIGSNKLHFGLFRAFQTYAEFAGLARDYGYFTDPDEASAWVEAHLIQQGSSTQNGHFIQSP